MAKRKPTRAKEGSWPPPMQGAQENPGFMEPDWGPRLPIPGPGRPDRGGPNWGPPPIGRPPGTPRPGSSHGGGAWPDGPGSGFDVLQNPFRDNPTRPWGDDPFGPRVKDVGDFPFDPDRWVASQEAPTPTRPKKRRLTKNKSPKKSKGAKSRSSGSRGRSKGK